MTRFMLLRGVYLAGTTR